MFCSPAFSSDAKKPAAPVVEEVAEVIPPPPVPEAEAIDVALPLPPRIKVMNVCGGHERSITTAGLRKAIPSNIELVPGPGCPVCVTPLETIDRALAIAARADVIFCSFGDMIRVPRGTKHWFNLCGDRTVRAIRLFQDISGWMPHYTDSGVDAGYQPLCFGVHYIRSAN